MATIDDLPLTDEEREELERRKRAGLPTLDEEIVRKYDPERLQRMITRSAGRGEPLDMHTRGEMERRLPGYDFSKVRVFRGVLAEEVTARHKADAVTIANTGMILVRDSARSAPGTTSGQALIAHELTHVAQAQRGMLFAKEQEGEGEYEEEAEEIQYGVESGNDPDASHEIGQELSHDVRGHGRTMQQLEARRERIIHRALELLDRRHEDDMDRRGSFNSR